MRSKKYKCKWCGLEIDDLKFIDNHIRKDHDEDTVKEFDVLEVVTLG